MPTGKQKPHAVAAAPAPPPGELVMAIIRGDRAAIPGLAALVAGDRHAKSLAELAKWFGVSVVTVKTGWRKSGDMPGREGQWPLREILLWKIDRELSSLNLGEQEPDARSASRDVLNRKRVADASKAEADAAIKNLKCEQLSGNLLYRDDVEREVTEHIAVVRHTLSRLPATLKPRFPKGLADELESQLRVEIEAAMRYLADLPAAVSPSPRPETVSCAQTDQTAAGKSECQEPNASTLPEDRRSESPSPVARAPRRRRGTKGPTSPG
jgi:phage terminase Nu1 subunit (DNA packaging protein)